MGQMQGPHTAGPANFNPMFPELMPRVQQTDMAVGSDESCRPKEMSTDARDLVRDMRASTHASASCNTEGVRTSSMQCQAGVRTAEIGAQAKAWVADSQCGTASVQTVSQGIQSKGATHTAEVSCDLMPPPVKTASSGCGSDSPIKASVVPDSTIQKVSTYVMKQMPKTLQGVD